MKSTPALLRPKYQREKEKSWTPSLPKIVAVPLECPNHPEWSSLLFDLILYKTLIDPKTSLLLKILLFIFSFSSN